MRQQNLSNMAKHVWFSISLCLLVLVLNSECTLALRRQTRLQQRAQLADCLLDKLEPLEPDLRIESEGGVTESWNHNNPQLRCAGVTLIRRTVYPKGLVMPSYTNSPQVMYVIEGKALQGMTIFPSCPEAFEDPDEGPTVEFRESHQKVHEVDGGDLIAIPAGIGYWFYNHMDKPLVVVILLDTSNHANQLDPNPRRFYLAGNPDDEHAQSIEDGKKHSSVSSSSGRNIYSGMDPKLLSQVYNVSVDTILKMQGAGDKKKNIVLLEEGLDVLRPHPEERSPQRTLNGIEETICTLRVRENMDSPKRADFYTPHAGRIAAVNGNKLPIMKDLQLSAERGVLYKYGVYAPHWNVNGDSVMYVTGGRGRMQVVDNIGRTVFDGELVAGQVLVIPQGFVVVKQAKEEGFEWASFKTVDNAMVTPLVGRSSAIRAFPAELLAKIYGISKEEAERLKYSRGELYLFRFKPSGSEKTAYA